MTLFQPDDCDESADDGADHVTDGPTLSASATHSHTHMTLKKHVITRWNSVLIMLESLLDLKAGVQESLKRIGHMDLLLTTGEWDILQDLCEFLTLFQDLTQLVSSSMTSLSLIPLIKDEIVEAVTISAKDSPSLRELKRVIAKKVDKRFPITRNIQLATLLDPSTKDVLGITNDEKIDILHDALTKQDEEFGASASALEVEAEGTQGSGESGVSGTCDQESPDCAQLVLSPVLSKKRKLLQKKKTLMCDSSDKAHDEIKRYLTCTATGEEEDNPLNFWKERCRDFPMLSKLCRVYLAISASSVPVECMFSVTGLILNGKRSSLAPYKLNYLSFIHDNFPLFCTV
jgi:hypothetical protein